MLFIGRYSNAATAKHLIMRELAGFDRGYIETFRVPASVHVLGDLRHGRMAKVLTSRFTPIRRSVKPPGHDLDSQRPTETASSIIGISAIVADKDAAVTVVTIDGPTKPSDF